MELWPQLNNFQTFLDVRLFPDLRRAIINQDMAGHEIKSYERLWEDLETFAELEKPTTVKLDIGNEIYANVRLYYCLIHECTLILGRDDSDKLLVDVGKGIFVELSVREARRFCHEKIHSLKLRLWSLKDREIDIRVHIDLVIMNLEELRKTMHDDVSSRRH